MPETISTVIYDDVATELPAEIKGGQLWIDGSGLTRTTRFELKPQGLCRGELCYPLAQATHSELVHESRINLTALAKLMGQPVAHDPVHAAWYFGVRSDQRRQLASLEAPDFTLPDIDGALHSLSDFRGKKVFLVTWASW